MSSHSRLDTYLSEIFGDEEKVAAHEKMALQLDGLSDEQLQMVLDLLVSMANPQGPEAAAPMGAPPVGAPPVAPAPLDAVPPAPPEAPPEGGDVLPFEKKEKSEKKDKDDDKEEDKEASIAAQPVNFDDPVFLAKFAEADTWGRELAREHIKEAGVTDWVKKPIEEAGKHYKDLKSSASVGQAVKNRALLEGEKAVEVGKHSLKDKAGWAARAAGKAAKDNPGQAAAAVGTAGAGVVGGVAGARKLRGDSKKEGSAVPLAAYESVIKQAMGGAGMAGGLAGAGAEALQQADATGSPQVGIGRNVGRMMGHTAAGAAGGAGLGALGGAALGGLAGLATPGRPRRTAYEVLQRALLGAGTGAALGGMAGSAGGAMHGMGRTNQAYQEEALRNALGGQAPQA